MVSRLSKSASFSHFIRTKINLHNFYIFSFHPPFHTPSIVLHLLLFPPFTFPPLFYLFQLLKLNLKPSFNLNLSTCYSTYLNFTFTLLSFQLNDNHLQFILYYYRTTKEFICPSFTFCMHIHPCLFSRKEATTHIASNLIFRTNSPRIQPF